MALICGDGVGLLEAWRVWFSGDSTEHLMVCGSSLLWWGRIGKVIEFVSGLYIVAEIVGPYRIQKLRGSLESLRNDVIFPRMADAVRKRLAMTVLASFFLLIIISYGYCFFEFGWSGCWRIVRCTPSEGPVPPYCSMEEQWYYFLTKGIPILIGSAAPIAVLLLIAFIIGVIIPSFILRPLAWILRRDFRWTKAISLLLLAVGFHFDLLAS